MTYIAAKNIYYWGKKPEETDTSLIVSNYHITLI